MNGTYTVYKHTGPTGKVYIGITRREPRKRFDGGRGYAHSPHFSAAIKKYGWDAFQHDILLTGLTREDAEEAEIRLIAEYKSTDRRFGYNADTGGSASGRMSEETRRKIASHMMGDNNPTRKYGHPMQGKRHTDESKARMSAAAKARTGRYVSDETKAKLRKAQKKTPVRCVELGIIYAGIHEAAEEFELSPSKVCAVCKGRNHTAGGLHWEYVVKE